MLGIVMNTDPYITPATYPPAVPIPDDAGTVSATAVQQLAATKPWVRFISVMTFVGAGFMLIAAAGMAVLGVVGGVAGRRMPAGPANNPFTSVMGFGLAALYVVLAIVYIFPGIKLWKYANAIAALIESGRNKDLVAALNQQRSFWKFVGIMLISIFVLYFIAIIGFVAFAGIAAAKAH